MRHLTIDRDEEIRLLAIVAHGRAAAAELAGNPGPARRVELQALVRAGDDARAAVIEAHQGFVALVARRHRARRVPLADLIQEGNIGLLAALDRFDPAVGVRFKTFAFYWVRQTIVAALPHHLDGMATTRSVVREANRVRKVRAQLESKLGRSVTAVEVAEATELSVRRVRELERLVAGLLPLNDEIAHTVVNTVDDGDPANRDSDDGPEVRSLLERLPGTQRMVIASRYGFATPDPQLQSEIADALGVTVSRVSQIERKALEELRRLADRVMRAA